MHQFLNISYGVSLKDYYEEFKRFSVNLPSIPNEIVEQTFLNGLKLEIQAELSRDQLVTLKTSMDTSLSARKCLAILWNSNSQGGHSYSGSGPSLSFSSKKITIEK